MRIWLLVDINRTGIGYWGAVASSSSSCFFFWLACFYNFNMIGEKWGF